MSSLYDELCHHTINARRRARLALLALALLLGGCYMTNTGLPQPTAAPPTLPPPTPTVSVEIAALPAELNPLTGTVPRDPSALNRRPMVVKISNAPPLVRPQAGVGAADLVFEHYTEGGLTRFSAVFWSQAPARIGSIRSARLIDDELTAMFQALLAYSGASDGVQAILNSADFFARSYRAPTPYFYRDDVLVAPHNLFLDAGALYGLAAAQGYGQRPDVRGWTFADAPPAGTQGSGVIAEIDYAATQASWLYDASRGAYLRFSDGQPHLDANTGAQVSADNVVILYVPHRDTDIVESVWNDVISYSIEIELWGEGDALLIRDGQRYTARWVRTQRDQPLRLTTTEGVPLPLKPGVTWFQVFPPAAQQRPGEERIDVR